MALTKAVTVPVTDWTAVAQNAVGESGTEDLSAVYAATFHVQFALTSATAHTGTKIELQVSANTSGDEDWITRASLISITGTPNTENITNNPLAAASVSATCASTVGEYDDDETRWIYIKDGTIANSELVYLVSHVSNTSVTWQDGTTNEHAQNTPMWDMAKTYEFITTLSDNRGRIIIDNTFDSNGATCDFRVLLTKVTAL